MKLFVQITQSYLLDIYMPIRKNSALYYTYVYTYIYMYIYDVCVCIYMYVCMYYMSWILYHSSLKIDECRTTIRIRAHKLNRNTSRCDRFGQLGKCEINCGLSADPFWIMFSASSSCVLIFLKYHWTKILSYAVTG